MTELAHHFDFWTETESYEALRLVWQRLSWLSTRALEVWLSAEHFD